MSSINQFGRIKAPPDGRDRRFAMDLAMPQIAAQLGKPKPRKRAYRDGPLLDQGPYPYCVGYACRGLLDGAPIMTKQAVGPDAVKIYAEAQVRDEWPGEEYEGTSVRGAMRYLLEKEYIASYTWAQTVDEAIAWMNGGYGTIVVGTNWYAEMSHVDSDGFIREPAGWFSWPLGGHAYRWIWYDAKKNGILMRNSWGRDFGIPDKDGLGTGYAYIRKAFAERLLREEGEIAGPTQVKIKPGM